MTARQKIDVIWNSYNRVSSNWMVKKHELSYIFTTRIFPLM